MSVSAGDLRRRVAWLLVMGAAALASSLGAQSAPPHALALTNVTVVDVREGRLIPEQTVVVGGNRIVAVGPVATTTPPAGARVVDARGRYLMPGLWDMHIHALLERRYEHNFALLIANGVTGFREPWGDLALARRIREEVLAGRRIAPRFIVSGNLVDGSPPVWPAAIVVTTETQGRAVVDSLKRAGAAFIKVYSRLPPNVYFAIADEARSQGIPVEGHVPSLVRASEASDAGQRSMEHLGGVLHECSRDPEAILEHRRRMAEALMTSAEPSDIADANQAILAILAAGRDERRCAELLAKLARNGTWQVPTLVVLRGQAFAHDLALRDDPRWKYVSRRTREGWDPSRNRFMRARTDEDWRLVRGVFGQQLELVALMHRAGVRVLAGSDASNPYAFPGFGAHEELELLVRAGLRPDEALRTATLNPARYLDATDSLGTVEAGKLADLVLLDGDPLKDVRYTQRIRAVVLNGRYLDRKFLDGLLAQAARAVAPVARP